jgi:hypothetical protein
MTSAVCNENVNVNQSDPNKSAPSLSKVLEEPFRDIEVPDEGAICNTVVCSSIFAILNHQRMQEWLLDPRSPLWYRFPKGPQCAGPRMQSTLG